MTDDTLLKDFRTEYAKSGAAKCRVCEEKIAKVLSLLSLLDWTVKCFAQDTL